MKSGKISESVLKRSVLRQIGMEREKAADGAGLGKDCAVFSFPAPDPASCKPEGYDSAACNPTGQNPVIRQSEGCDSGTCNPTGQDPGNGKSKGCDSGTCNPTEQRLVTCMQEGILSSRDGEKLSSMSRLIQKCANNLAAGGARMTWLMIALILPEETEEADLKALMRQAGEKCEELGVKIAGGQTRVSRAVNLPVAVVTGYGIPFEENTLERDRKKAGAGTKESSPRPGEAAPGQDVVISKWIGLEGTARLAEKNREKLLARYPARLVEEAAGFDRWLSVIPEAATAVKSGVCAMHDASEGGILGSLWELAARAGVGLTIDLKKLPLRQETVEVCECCNANPYELLSGGSLVMTAWDGSGLAAALEAEGIPAAVVGKVTDSNDRVLTNEDEVRYMDRPKQDEIYRLGME